MLDVYAKVFEGGGFRQREKSVRKGGASDRVREVWVLAVRSYMYVNEKKSGSACDCS